MAAMPRVLLAATVTIGLLGAAPAGAEYWLSKTRAQFYAGHYARQHWDVRGVVANCYPKNHTNADTVHYVWHKWTCYWVGYENYGDGPACAGKVLIKGRPGQGNYIYRTMVGERC
jgi:hypothetical protein